MENVRARKVSFHVLEETAISRRKKETFRLDGVAKRGYFVGRVTISVTTIRSLVVLTAKKKEPDSKRKRRKQEKAALLTG